MSLSGLQTSNAGYLAAQAYFNDPSNATAPTPSFKEGELGVAAFTLAQLAAVTSDASRIPTADQDAAIDGASSPGPSNVFATMNDLAAFSSPTSVVYNFSTTVGVPSSGEITMDNATPASVTEIYLHNLNRAGQNVGNILLTLDNGDAIIIQDNLEGDKTYNFDITGAPTQTGGSGASGYVTIPVSLFAEGATQITSSDVVVAATYVNGGSTIPAANISGALTNATIAGSAVTGNITASQVNGALTNATLATSDLTGTVNLASQVSGTLPGSSVGTGISATNITTGTLSGSLVGTGISATNITTGTLSGSLVGTGISATNITTGTLSGSLVGSGVPAASIASGTLTGVTLDATSVVPVEALPASAVGSKVIYCSTSGSGDESGIDASNRMPEEDIYQAIQDNFALKLIFASGDYTTTNPLYPFRTASSEIISNRRIEIELEGDVTFGSMDFFGCDVSIYKTQNASTYTLTIGDDIQFTNCKVVFKGDDTTSANEYRINLAVSDLIQLESSRVQAPFGTVNCARFIVHYNSTWVADGILATAHDLTVSGTFIDDFQVKYNSFVSILNSAFDKPSTGGAVDYNSIFRYGTIVDQTPTATNGSYLI